MATATELQQLYIAYFGRPADPTGLAYWVSSGISTKSFAALMFAQPEFQSVNSGRTVETQVNQLYTNLFGRPADAAGLLYWTNQINTGQIALASVANDLIFSATNSGAASAADRAALTNKTSTAVSYTAGLLADTDALLVYQPQSTSPWISGANFAAAVSFMTTATATNIPTAAQITASVGSFGKAGTQGQTFTLTPLVDIASGTTALTGSISNDFRFTGRNDTVNAITATMNTGDTLLDGSTTDVDVINITSTGAMNAITATNIETANVTFASGTPTAVFTNFSGLKFVNVSGTVAGTVVDAGTAAVAATSYGRVLTLQSDMVGAAASSNADTANVTMSGATFGTTTATQSGLVFDNTNAAGQVLETINITSSGSAANEFSLASSADTTFSTINVGGTAAATLRVANADVSGLTVNGTSGTGTVAVSIGADSAVTTNAFNFTGVDDIIFRDNNATAHNVALNNVRSGQQTTLASDAAAVTITVSGASAAAAAASVTLVLDNGTAAADLDVASLNVQDVTALNLVSSGFATSTSTSAENSIGALAGDFTSIVVTGDTSLDLDLNIDAPTTGTRAVTVNASGMTGTSFIDAAVENATTRVSYTVTGTDRNDTINMANALTSTVTAGLGNDTITGSAGVDTINAGAGNDTIVVSFGADSVTTGAGNDIVDINATGGAASAQTSTTAVITGAATIAANDQIIAVIDGQSYTYNSGGTTIATELAGFITAHGATITAAHNVVVTAGTGTLIFTGAATGTAFTSTVRFNDVGVGVSTPAITTVAGVLARDTSTSITDFSTTDKVDIAGLSLDGVYVEGAPLAATDYQVIVLTGASYANVLAASTAINLITDEADSAVVVYLNSTTGKAEAYLDNELQTDAVSGTDASSLVTFDNITTLTDLANVLSADSFTLA